MSVVQLQIIRISCLQPLLSWLKFSRVVPFLYYMKLWKEITCMRMHIKDLKQADCNQVTEYLDE